MNLLRVGVDEDGALVGLDISGAGLNRRLPYSLKRADALNDTACLELPGDGAAAG